VLHLAIGSDDFLKRAVEALVEIVELEAGYVILLRDDETWDAKPVAAYSKLKNTAKWVPSRTVLRGVVSKKIGIYTERQIDDGPSPSAAVYSEVSSAGKGAVVAAPLLDSQGAVIRVLYGECQVGDAGPDEIRLVLVKLLSSGVSAGLARQKKELEAAQEAARFEACFSKSLAAKLRTQPDMLKGKRATVTILFCDIRGYSGITTKPDPETSERWLHDVLGELSRCNRASRVQGMTKHLKGRVLLTGSARDALKSRYRTRRVVLTKVSGLEEPVSLFEAAAAGDGKAEFFAASEAALDALESALDAIEQESSIDSAAFSNAARQAGVLLGDHAGDGPLLLTLSRATDALIRDGQGCAKVWIPPGK